MTQKSLLNIGASNDAMLSAGPSDQKCHFNAKVGEGREWAKVTGKKRNQSNDITPTIFVSEKHDFRSRQERNEHGKAREMEAETRSITSLSVNGLEMRFSKQRPTLAACNSDRVPVDFKFKLELKEPEKHLKH